MKKNNNKKQKKNMFWDTLEAPWRGASNVSDNVFILSKHLRNYPRIILKYSSMQ